MTFRNKLRPFIYFLDSFLKKHSIYLKEENLKNLYDTIIKTSPNEALLIMHTLATLETTSTNIRKDALNYFNGIKNIYEKRVRNS